jgi:hypothetical protein
MMMRRLSLFAAALLVPVLLAVAGVPTAAGAQTANSSAFCAARSQLGPSASPEQMKTALATLAQSAGGSATPAATALDALYAKKGERTFNSDKAFGYLSAIDEYVYETCPGTAVDVDAVDYKFQGIPASLPAGTAKIKFTNGSPKEDHEIAIARLLPAGERVDPIKIFKMSDKKAAKDVDLDSAVFRYAAAGDVDHTVAQLEPGTYVYGCFIPVGGKENGAPHFMKGMYGTFTVS